MAIEDVDWDVCLKEANIRTRGNEIQIGTWQDVKQVDVGVTECSA